MSVMGVTETHTGSAKTAACAVLCREARASILHRETGSADRRSRSRAVQDDFHNSCYDRDASRWRCWAWKISISRLGAFTSPLWSSRGGSSLHDKLIILLDLPSRTCRGSPGIAVLASGQGAGRIDRPVTENPRPGLRPVNGQCRMRALPVPRSKALDEFRS
jgi:hypothetical protein